MDTVTVNVTREHIVAGKRHFSTSCPVALAVSEASPAGRVSVGTGMAFTSVPPGSLNWFAYLPDTARAWIQAFDEHGPDHVSPITFELDFQEVAS